MITSPENPHLKQIRRLTAGRSARARLGLFCAEGEDLVRAAAEAGWPAEAVLSTTPEPAEPGHHQVEARLLHDVSTLGSGTRQIGVYRQRFAPAPLAAPLCLYLHGVRDPGNVGTIVRSAHALGASSLILGADCADPFGPKAVRASMGAIFHLPLCCAAPQTLPGELVGLSAHATEPLRGPVTGPTTLLIGAERTGLPEELELAADRICRIPMVHGDSLNAAMAATVALYEMTRVSAG